METLPITLKEKQAVEGLRVRYGHSLASHAFASLYLWREQMGLSLLLTPDMFTARCLWQGENAWFFPCGGERAVADFVARGREEPGFSLCYLRGQDAAWLEDRFPGQWQLRRAPEADEYLYDVAGHLALAGGTYANLRTQVHKVEREYRPETRPLGEDTLADALDIIRRWEHGHCRFDNCVLRDDRVDEEALLLRRELEVTGIVLYLDGRPTAVSAGFFLAPGLFDLAVAKSVPTAQGVSYYAKRELFRRLDCAAVNLEEDLGIPGLRQMKNRLCPAAKNEIWEARPLWNG